MITPSNRTCPLCGKAGYIYYIDSISTYEAKCFNCNYYFVHGELNKYNKRQSTTNADRIRAMSDKELAKLLNKPIGYACRKNCNIENDGCEECVLEWLKKEVDE